MARLRQWCRLVAVHHQRVCRVRHLVCDQSRQLAMGCTSLPFNKLTRADFAIQYGMFAIILPACIAPVLAMLFWADWKAQKLGRKDLCNVSLYPADPFPDVSFASSDIAQRRQQGSDEPKKPFFRAALEYLDKMDAFGLLLLTFGWCLMLLPFTLSAGAKGGYDNRKLLPIFEDPSLQTVLC